MSDFDRKSLGDLADCRMGETILSKDLDGVGYPIFSADSSAGEWGRKRSISKVLRRGSIVVGARGTIGNPRLPDHDEFGCTQTTIAVTPSREVDPYFLKLALEYSDLKSIAAQQAVPMLTIGEISQLELPVPPLPEQKKIAEILSGIEKNIASIQKKIEKINLLSRFLLEDLIGNLLDGRGSTSEVRQIHDIATIKGGKRMPKGEPFSDAPTAYPYLRVSDMKHLSIDTQNLKYVPEKVQQQIKNYTISPQDVYITIAGSIGVVGMIPCELNGALLTENAAKISTTSESIIPRYLMYCLASSSVQRQFKEETGTGGGVPKLALFRIGNSSVPICSIETQHRIIRSMDGIAEEARILNSKQNLLVSIRKAISEDLLSGRKRVSI